MFSGAHRTYENEFPVLPNHGGLYPNAGIDPYSLYPTARQDAVHQQYPPQVQTSESFVALGGHHVYPHIIHPARKTTYGTWGPRNMPRCEVLGNMGEQ